MKTIKTYWQRLCERIVRGSGPSARVEGRRSKVEGQDAGAVPGAPARVDLTSQPEREGMDVEENDRVLVAVREDEPLLRVLMNYAYTHVENNMAVAFDPARSLDDQRDFKNRAAGVAALIGDIESTRIRLREEIVEKQRLEALKKQG
jgi:hypothetical protein